MSKSAVYWNNVTWYHSSSCFFFSILLFVFSFKLFNWFWIHTIRIPFFFLMCRWFSPFLSLLIFMRRPPWLFIITWCVHFGVASASPVDACICCSCRTVWPGVFSIVCPFVSTLWYTACFQWQLLDILLPASKPHLHSSSRQVFAQFNFSINPLSCRQLLSFLQFKLLRCN